MVRVNSRSEQSILTSFSFLPSFLLQVGYVSMGLLCFYALVGGSLADDYGTKPLLAMPIVGTIFEAVTRIVGYVFMDSLPIEYWYLAEMHVAFGGETV